MTGQTIGHYEILGKLGEGGMGVVYRARDTRLNREVAVKVLPAQFVHDPQRMARFEREARVLAALNHPHIAAIHGLEQSEGVRALVMELVEGPTLADRIAEGPMPVEEALGLALQIAAALESAHDHGIVHRDLKPANVKLTADGSVKVLDFGLAKAMDAEPGAGSPEDSPTMTMKATQAGMLLGTAAYMSPEQARGRPVDKRADIWAFGVVLYEMLTGRRLFRGEDIAETLASVMKDSPDLSKAPARARRVLEKCLEKDPRKRLRDISGVALLLESEEAPAARYSRLWLTAAALVVIVPAIGAWAWLSQPKTEIPSIQFHVDPPEGEPFANTNGGTAVSPDGSHLVFVAGTSNRSLWLRPLDSVATRRLPGTENANSPFWSPDGRSIGFFADKKLKRIELTGGAPLVLCPAEAGSPGAWNRDGVILFGGKQGLWRVRASGGDPEPVTKVDESRGEMAHEFPQFLPDGKRFLFFASSAVAKNRGVFAASLDRPSERAPILATETKSVYVRPFASRPGHLLWVRGQTLLAQPFDARTLRLEGELSPLTEEVAATGSLAAFWASDAAVLAYRSGMEHQRRSLSVLSRTGQQLSKAAPDDRYGHMRLSPDGRKGVVTLTDDDGNMDVWVVDFSRDVTTRLTTDPGRDSYPVWSPDGRQIAFSSDRTGVMQIFRKDAAGGGTEEQLTNGPNSSVLTDWSRDGRHLLYVGIGADTGEDLWVLPLDGDRKPIPVRRTRFRERGGQFSPDGKWIAFESGEPGRDEVAIMAFPNTGATWQVSNRGGNRVKWSRDGKEIFYLTPGGGTICSASVRTTGKSIETDAPRELFTISQLPDVFSPYDITPDGQRFVFLGGVEGPAPLTVVYNWQERLR